MSAEDRVRQLPCWTGAIELVPLKGGVSNASFTVRDSKRAICRPGGA